jgi:hypothetical protein
MWMEDVVRKREDKSPRGKAMHVGCFKTDLKQMMCGGVVWIQLALVYNVFHIITDGGFPEQLCNCLIVNNDSCNHLCYIKTHILRL